MAGIYITRGMSIRIPAGGLTLSLGDDGNVTGNLTFHVRFDVCPTWVELSMQHLQSATQARALRKAAWLETDEAVKASTLEREFEASMQAIMGAAVALDAFYAILQSYVTLPPSLVQKWRSKRTARSSQVTEVIRRAFQLKPKGTADLRTNIKEIYRFRDLAVHPSGKIEAPLLHPELGLGVEWRFAYFSATNAEMIVNTATGILWELCHRGKPKDPNIVKYVDALRLRLEVLFPNGHPNATAATPSQ